MLGGIYTDEKCRDCGRNLHDNHLSRLTCPDHPEIRATRMYVKFGKTKRRFQDWPAAMRFLTTLRGKTDEDTYDARDYARGNPLGYHNATREYLRERTPSWSPVYAANVRACLDACSELWGPRNVKTLRRADFVEYLQGLKVGDKTRHNRLGYLKAFFRWLVDQEYIDKLPKFPVVTFVERHRSPTTTDTQWAILEEIRRATWEYNPRIYLAVHMLATCFAIRPKELLGISLSDFDLERGVVTIRKPKTKRERVVPVPEVLLDLVRAQPADMPGLPFFRHLNQASGRYRGEAFSRKYLGEIWKRACAELGIEGVSLYPGTTHTTILGKRLEGYTPEELRMASMRESTRAWRHYFEMPLEDIRAIYSGRTNNEIGTLLGPHSRGQATNKKPAKSKT